MRKIALPLMNQLPARLPKAAPTLGIIGGGQLARMLAQSATQFGCDIVILERNKDCPAAHLAAETVIGNWDNPDSLLVLGSLVDVVTLENEFVDADSLTALDEFGHPLWPASATVRLVQDKLLQKRALAASGLPVPEFMAVPDKATIPAAAHKFGWPLVLKKRRNGYDGKGNFTLRSAADIDQAWTALGGEANTLYVEQFCPFTRELAIMITRGHNGEIATYPVVETVQRDHICHLVKAPADIPAELAVQVTEIARKAVQTVSMVGTMGIEFFLTADGGILINELAPRVHNSGHYTIEACVCSQFENHIRAVLGLPLGSTAMRAPSAVMFNLLGACKGSGTPHGLAQALAIPDAHPHIYGKAVSATGRKMGHVTALGKNFGEALATCQKAAAAIRFGGEA
jgi:5-(carboxyamino)imidazole ribonucleotide synthase